jgi:Coenzyme PQQ synthesis protein D (PqqD)
MNPQILTTELEDGAVLLDVERGIYYSLNSAGLEVWRRVDSTGRVDDLTTELMRLFEVDETTASDSVARFVGELDREGLLAPGDAPARTAGGTRSAAGSFPDRKRPFEAPVLIKHEEPLYEVTSSPFDPQLPLAE